MAKYADKDASSWLIAIVTARKDKQDFLDVTELITGNLDNLQRAMQLQLSLQLPTKADFHHPFDMEAAAAKVLELSGEQDVTAGLRKLSRSNKQADMYRPRRTCTHVLGLPQDTFVYIVPVSSLVTSCMCNITTCPFCHRELHFLSVGLHGYSPVQHFPV